MSGKSLLLNVEASPQVAAPAPHRRAAVRFFGRFFSLAAICFVALAGLAEDCHAGVILTCESMTSVQTLGDASAVLPGDNHQHEGDERVSAEHRNMLPSGTGAAAGGAPLGISTVAALHQPSGLFPLPALCSLLEERRLSLPASPVFDRLQPPRG